MNGPDFFSATVARQELEGFWRRKLEDAQRRYQTGTARYRKLLGGVPEGRVRSQDDSLALARHAKAAALAEYSRLLKIFIELTVNNRMYHRRSGSIANGCAQ